MGELQRPCLALLTHVEASRKPVCLRLCDVIDSNYLSRVKTNFTWACLSDFQCDSLVSWSGGEDGQQIPPPPCQPLLPLPGAFFFENPTPCQREKNPQREFFKNIWRIHVIIFCKTIHLPPSPRVKRSTDQPVIGPVNKNPSYHLHSEIK